VRRPALVMSDLSRMAAHSADLPILCVSKLVTNANITGEGFATAQEAPMQLQTTRNEWPSVGHSGSDTNQHSGKTLETRYLVSDH